MKVLVAGRIRYPEASVVCSEVTPDAQYLTDPVVIFEVLSDGTANDDLVVKNAEYRDTPSIQRYVVLQQTHVSATVFCRHGDFWVADTATGEDAVLHMPEIEISIPLSEIYKGVRLRGAEEPGPAN